MQTSVFSWFLSYPPWYVTDLCLCCTSLAENSQYPHSYQQTVSWCWPTVLGEYRKHWFPLGEFTKTKSNITCNTCNTLGLWFYLTQSIPALVCPAVKWNPPWFKWSPGFSWTHEFSEKVVFCRLSFSSVKANQVVSSEGRMKIEWCIANFVTPWINTLLL